MNRDLQERVVLTINTYIPQIIEEYLEDHPAKQNIVDLVLTLKSWANPDSNYPHQLNHDEHDDFKYLIAILNEPRKILSQEKSFTNQDESEIKLAVQAKLNSLADELIKQHQLSEEINQYLHADKNEITRWWESKSQSEQEQIREDFLKLSAEDKAVLKAKAASISNNSIYINPYPDPFWFFLYTHHHCYLPCYYRYNYPVWSPFFPIILPVGGSSSGHGRSCGDCDGDVIKAVGIAGAIAAGIAIISAGVIAALYATKKACNSLINLVTGNKMLRSLFRLAGIGGGGYGGFLVGPIAGAFLGSIVPGVGTVLGALLGGLFVAGIGAGLGALATKYIAKGISYIIHSDEFNPTNPEKYHLTNNQQNNLRHKGFDLEIVDQMIHAIHQEKSRIGRWGSFFWTEERNHKNQLNALLNNLKHHPERLPPANPIMINKIAYDPQLSRFFTPPPKAQSTTAQLISQFGNEIGASPAIARKSIACSEASSSKQSHIQNDSVLNQDKNDESKASNLSLSFGR